MKSLKTYVKNSRIFASRQSQILTVAMAFAMFFILASFQNCGNFGQNIGNGNEGSASIPPTPTPSPIQIIEKHAELDWQLIDKGNWTLDRFSRCEKWSARGSIDGNLYPPFAAGSRRLNMDASPELKIDHLAFKATNYLQLSDYDLPNSIGSEFTIQLVLANVTLGAKESASGDQGVRIFDLYPLETVDQLGHLALSLERVTVSGQVKYRYRSLFWFDNNNYAVRDLYLTQTELASKHLLTLIYPKASTNMSVLFNGKETTENVITVGQPKELGESTRSILFNSPGSPTELSLYRLSIAKKALANKDLNELGLAIAELEQTPYEGRQNLPDDDNGTPPVTTFAELSQSGSKGVFYSYCISCHGGTSPSAGLNLSSFDAARTKIALIITRLESPTAPMPSSGNLSVQLINYVKQWRDAGTPQ